MTVVRSQEGLIGPIGERLRRLSDTVLTEKESLNTMIREIQSLLHTRVDGVLQVVDACEQEAIFFSHGFLKTYVARDKLRTQREEIQAELQQANETNKKVEGQLQECRNELHVLQKERNEALVTLGMADKSTTLNQAVQSAMLTAKKKLECELDELKAERASTELAFNKKVRSLEAVRDAVLPSAGQLVVAQTKKRKWKHISTSTGEENARLQTAALAMHRELEEEQEKSVCHICFVRQKDALLLPCLHFHFCHQCVDESLKTNNLCPTCRTDVSEVLKCKV